MTDKNNWETKVAAVRVRYLRNKSEAKALKKTCEQYQSISFEALCKQPKWPRIFIWHNFVLEMLLASQLFDREDYASQVERFIIQLNRQPDRGYSLFSVYPPHGPALVVTALAVALKAFDATLSDAAKSAFRDVIYAYCSAIAEEQKNAAWGDDKVARLMWNHSIVGYVGLYFGGVTLFEDEKHRKEAKNWYELGREKSLAYVTHGLTRCGVNREGFAYAGMTLKAVSMCLYNELIINGSLARDILERLGKYVEYVAYEVVPMGGLVWNYNDSYMDPRLGMNGYLIAAELCGKKDLAMSVWSRLLGDAGNKTYGSDKQLWRSSLFETLVFGEQEFVKDAITTLPTSRYFEDKGYYVYRSSWENNAIAFTFSCGEGIERIHQQSDHNSFTLAIDGQPVVIDSGPCNKPIEDSFSQSNAHQSILIDGKGMALCGGKLSTSGKIIEFNREEAYTYIHGDALPAYNKKKHQRLSLASREIWLSDHAEFMVVVRDTIRSKMGKQHRFDWLLHTPSHISVSEAPSQNELVEKHKVFSFYDERDSVKSELFSLIFVGVVPDRSSTELKQNNKAYDDQLILKHYRHTFTFEKARGDFWVILIPASASKLACLELCPQQNELKIQCENDANTMVYTSKVGAPI